MKTQQVVNRSANRSRDACERHLYRTATGSAAIESAADVKPIAPGHTWIEVRIRRRHILILAIGRAVHTDYGGRKNTADRRVVAASPTVLGPFPADVRPGGLA